MELRIVLRINQNEVTWWLYGGQEEGSNVTCHMSRVMSDIGVSSVLKAMVKDQGDGTCGATGPSTNATNDMKQQESDSFTRRACASAIQVTAMVSESVSASPYCNPHELTVYLDVPDDPRPCSHPYHKQARAQHRLAVGLRLQNLTSKRQPHFCQTGGPISSASFKVHPAHDPSLRPLLRVHRSRLSKLVPSGREIRHTLGTNEEQKVK